jgi:hypothetical protein
MGQALRFCVRSDKPWMLLLPNYVCYKPFYERSLAVHPSTFMQHPMFIVPNTQYHFMDRKANKKSTDGLMTAPYNCFWYLSMGMENDKSLKRQWPQLLAACEPSPNESKVGLRVDCQLAESRAKIPTHALDSDNPRNRGSRHHKSNSKRKHEARQGSKGGKGRGGGARASWTTVKKVKPNPSNHVKFG